MIGCLQTSGGGTNRVGGEQRREILDSTLITSWLVTTREVGLYMESWSYQRCAYLMIRDIKQ